MAKRRHAGPHKYKRIKWGDKETEVWRCFHPDCTHYLHPQFIEGKTTACWGCGHPCLMTKERILRVKPICDECKDKKRGLHDQLQGFQDLIGNLE